MTWLDRLAVLATDGKVAFAGALAAGWNLMSDGRLNNAAALAVAALTMLVLVQKAALNCRRWRRERVLKDGRNAAESGGGGI